MTSSIGRFLAQITAVIVAGCLLTSCATMSPLHDAAIRGDVQRIEKYVEQGMPVDGKDTHGNTPLHYAYYHGQAEAIDRLLAFGADASIRNKEGDTPLDMEKIAAAEGLLQSGSHLLDVHANWTDRVKGRATYDELCAMDGAIVTKAIVRKVIRNENRLRVLFLAVKLGIPASEERLNDVLHGYGDKSMAEDYLNSGSQALYEGGRRWANSHGYYISTGMGSHRVRWRSFD